MYDPVVGRFLSPDPYIQAPDFSQNFNRYSYGLNNPLRYTDPSGEIIPLLIVAGVGFGIGYVSHGISTGNWGINAVYSGLLGGAMFTAGYLSMDLSSSSFMGMMQHFSVAGAVKYSGLEVASAILSNIIDPINIPLWDGASLSVSPVAMLTAGIGNAGLGDGFRFGAGITASQRIGDWTLMGGGSLFNSGSTFHGGFSYDDGKQGFSFVGNKYNYGNAGGQTTGTFGYRNGDFSVKHENDLFGRFLGSGKQDRFRTAALEMGYKNLSAGFSIYTTNPSVDEKGRKLVSEDYSKNGKGIYTDGYQLASPFYIGIRQKNSVTRIGLNAPAAGWFQNGLHRYVTKDPDFYYGAYGQPYINRGNSINSSSLYTY